MEPGRLVHFCGRPSFPTTIHPSSCCNTDNQPSAGPSIPHASLDHCTLHSSYDYQEIDSFSHFTQGLPIGPIPSTEEIYGSLNLFPSQFRYQQLSSALSLCQSFGHVMHTPRLQVGLNTDGDVITPSSATSHTIVTDQHPLTLMGTPQNGFFEIHEQRGTAIVSNVNHARPSTPSLFSKPPGSVPMLSKFDSTSHNISIPLDIDGFSLTECNDQSLNIPQRPYFPNESYKIYQSDGHDYVAFMMESGAGYPVKEALRKNYARLMNRDYTGMLGGNSSSISIRIEWPGYPSWNRQVKTTTWHGNAHHITLQKLATEVAVSLKRFIEKNQTKPIDKAEERWQVGPIGSSFIHVNRIILVGLERVSKASWQPIFHLLT